MGFVVGQHLCAAGCIMDALRSRWTMLPHGRAASAARGCAVQLNGERRLALGRRGIREPTWYLGRGRVGSSRSPLPLQKKRHCSSHRDRLALYPLQITIIESDGCLIRGETRALAAFHGTTARCFSFFY